MPIASELSAFPLTPLTDDRVDEAAYSRLVGRLAEAGVDSIAALGSTGSYAYLDRNERRRVATLAVESAGPVPVIVGIGATRTSAVLGHAHDAQNAGASAVLLAPVSYQPLTPDEVYGLYEDVTAHLSVPLIVYDNPGTTRFQFTLELYSAIAALPQVTGIKIPPGGEDLDAATQRIAKIRAAVPEHVSIGISGDSSAVTALRAGCDTWYSVIAGTLPHLARRLNTVARSGDARAAQQETERLRPL